MTARLNELLKSQRKSPLHRRWVKPGAERKHFGVLTKPVFQDLETGLKQGSVRMPPINNGVRSCGH
jgi:hypothetical protein